MDLLAGWWGSFTGSQDSLKVKKSKKNRAFSKVPSIHSVRLTGHKRSVLSATTSYFSPSSSPLPPLKRAAIFCPFTYQHTLTEVPVSSTPSPSPSPPVRLFSQRKMFAISPVRKSVVPRKQQKVPEIIILSSDEEEDEEDDLLADLQGSSSTDYEYEASRAIGRDFGVIFCGLEDLFVMMIEFG